MNNTTGPTSEETWHAQQRKIGRLIELTGAVLLLVFGFILNMGAIIIIKRKRKKFSWHEKFIIILLGLNLGLCLLILPLQIVIKASEQLLGVVTCRLYAFAFFFVQGTTIFNLLILTVHRYLKIVHTDTANRIEATQAYLIITIIAWIIITVILLPPSLNIGAEFGFNAIAHACTFVGKHSILYRNLMYSFTVGIPLVVMITCYLHIYITVRRQNRKMITHQTESHQNPQAKRRRKRELDITKTTVLICATYIIGFVPLVICSAMGMAVKNPVVQALASTLGLAHCVINPLIYVNSSHKQVLNTIRNICPCTSKVTEIEELSIEPSIVGTRAAVPPASVVLNHDVPTVTNE